MTHELISQSTQQGGEGETTMWKGQQQMSEWQEYWKSEHVKWRNKTGPGLWEKA